MGRAGLMTPTEYAARLAALTSARPIDYRALALFHLDHQLDGIVNRPRMYAADDIRVLEALAWQVLYLRDVLRCPEGSAGHDVVGMMFMAAHNRNIYCGNTFPAYAKPTLAIEEMSLIIHDAWKLCDEAWPMEEES